MGPFADAHANGGTSIPQQLRRKDGEVWAGQHRLVESVEKCREGFARAAARAQDVAARSRNDRGDELWNRREQWVGLFHRTDLGGAGLCGAGHAG